VSLPAYGYRRAPGFCAGQRRALQDWCRGRRVHLRPVPAGPTGSV